MRVYPFLLSVSALVVFMARPVVAAPDTFTAKLTGSYDRDTDLFLGGIGYRF